MGLILKPAYTYAAQVVGIYDGDTLVMNIDLYDNLWKHNEIIRMYGINANELKKSVAKNRGADHVLKGWEDRDVLINGLKLNPDNFPRKVKYHDTAKAIKVALDIDGDGEPDHFEYCQYPTPVDVVIQTIKKEKFGRMLGIIHKDGVNLNEMMRDQIGGVEFYDQKIWPANTPIIPPV